MVEIIGFIFNRLLKGYDFFKLCPGWTWSCVKNLVQGLEKLLEKIVPDSLGKF